MLCLVDFSNLKGRSKVMRSVCLHNDTEFDASMRDACLQIISCARSSCVVFCLDGSPDFRLSLLPTYKGKRKKSEPNEDGLPIYPDELLVADMRMASRSYNTPVFLACSPHREADDVIASIIKKVKEDAPENLFADSRLSWWAALGQWRKGVFDDVSELCIMSSDSDLQQLMRCDSQKVSIVSKMNLSDARYTVSKTFEKLGVNSPAELLAYKLIEGDSGDDIPRSRILPPRKIGNLFWKTLNTEDKIFAFLNNPDAFPEIAGFVDIEKFRRNANLIWLDSRAYPLSTPFLFQI